METDFAEHWAKITAIVSQSALVFVGLSTNVLLMYAIIRHTPASFKNYSSLLLLTAINDASCLICDSVLIQRIIPTPIIIAQVWHGACSFLSKETCYNIFSVYLHTLTNSMLLMVVSFWYRHAILHNSQPPRSLKLVIIIAVLYIPSFVQMVTLPLSTWKDADVKRELSQYYPNLDYARGPITGNSAHGNIFADYGTYYAMLLPVPCYTFILIARFKASCTNIEENRSLPHSSHGNKEHGCAAGALSSLMRAIGEVCTLQILRVIRRAGSCMSERTRELHVQLIRALTYHACLPIFSVISDTMTTIMLLNLFRHPLMENFVFVSASLPSCISPIITIAFIRPYRAFVLRQKRKVHPRAELYDNSSMTISAQSW